MPGHRHHVDTRGDSGLYFCLVCGEDFTSRPDDTVECPGPGRAIPNSVPITREDEQRALDKGMAEERAKGWRGPPFKPERSAEEESELADKLHNAIPNSAAEDLRLDKMQPPDAETREWMDAPMGPYKDATRKDIPKRAAEVLCPDCDGDGTYERNGERVDCEWCAGTGHVNAPHATRNSADKVWIVTHTRDYPYHADFMGVFSTKEKAEAWVSEQPLPDNYTIEEWPVDG